MKYPPPITITPTLLKLVAAISERLGRYAEREQARALRLRRAKRMPC